VKILVIWHDNTEAVSRKREAGRYSLGTVGLNSLSLPVRSSVGQAQAIEWSQVNLEEHLIRL